MSTATKPERAEAPAASVSPRRSSRLQNLGIFFLMLGGCLLWVSGHLPTDDITFVFGLGDLAPRILLDPPNAVLAIGMVYLIAGGIALAGRRTGRYATVALVTAAVLLVPLTLVLSVSLGTVSQTNLLPLLTEALRLSTPIALGALAGLWCERAGVVNIGIEGMMLASAGIGFTFYAAVGGAAGGPWLIIAVLVSVAVGGLLALLHAVLCVTFRTDQIISGVAINLLAIGITSFLRRQVLLPLGVGTGVTLSAIDIPVLSSIPVVGPTLFTGKPIFLSMFIIVALSRVILFRTAWGLRVRAVGEKPHAAETLGVNVIRTRYQSVVLGGLIAGLAGAWFTLETVGSFEDLMTNGTGFIALAALIFGKWRPWPAFGGALLFGFSSALGSRIQLLGVEVNGFPVPSQFLQVLPYVVTIVVLAGAIGRAVPPASDGIPYEPSR